MRAAFVTVAICLLAPAVGAFDGNEHKDVSNAALRLAQPAAPCDMKRVIEDLLVEGQTLGDLTRAVDWFQEPERFAVSGKWEDIKGRKWAFLKRGLAIHRNSDHFQFSAAEHYTWLHEQAISEAAEHHPREALWYEAFALHFLQDFFAPGHAVTPRKGTHDAISAALHDRFNDTGLQVELHVQEMPSEVTFRGDGLMRPEQREFLIRISAQSICDLFKAYKTSRLVRASLELCFWPRAAKPLPDDRPDPHAFRGPYAALRHPITSGREECQCKENVIARYENLDVSSKDMQDIYSLPFRAFRGAVYGVPARGGGRIVVDAATYFEAWDPPNSIRRDDPNNPCSRETYGHSLSGGFLVSTTAILGDRYRAFGVAFEPDEPLIDQPIHVAQWVQDIYISGYFAARRYFHDGRHNTAYDVGSKLSIGFNVANVVVVVERGHRVSSRDDFEHKMFYMLGGELVFSRSWFGLLRPKR
jgi:hypothetical protein